MIKNNIICLESIEISDPIIENNKCKTHVVLKKIDGSKSEFILKLSYSENLSQDDLSLLRLAFCMPILNYGLFTKKILLNFSISKADMDLLKELLRVFSLDILVNKIFRKRTNYIKQEYIPEEKKIKIKDENLIAKIKSNKIIGDESITKNIFNKKSCGVLSSGGKESLLTYGLLKEIGAEVHPIYVNESGGHWRTAVTAYRYHKKNEKLTKKVWTNVDRFYVFMLDNLEFIRSDHRKIRADTYPIRLCIFPFYVFSLLPLFVKYNIGNLLIGSEFDDERVKPSYNNIPHYFGVYDQHQDYDVKMQEWYDIRLPGMKQWSALRSISGLIVEKILVRRYPELANLQRSCHSCHIQEYLIMPCGKCSKCFGVLLFLLANNEDPKIMLFQEKDIKNFSENIYDLPLRLDQDEKNHSLSLIQEHNQNDSEFLPIDHVEMIHKNKGTIDLSLLPKQFRKPILDILEEYTNGYCILKNEKWIPSKKEMKIML